MYLVLCCVGGLMGVSIVAGGRAPPPYPSSSTGGARTGSGLLEKAARAAREGHLGGMRGNLFWKQWQFPGRVDGYSEEEEEGVSAEEYEMDNRPLRDLIPRLTVSVEPLTSLKLRKRFYPFGASVLELGADYNTQQGLWQFRSSWEDRWIGGRLTIKGRELQFSKSWIVTLGDQDDIASRIRFRAGVDTATWRSYARLGFRTERIHPLNLSKDGVSIRRRLPLDGPDGHTKLEVRASISLPEPEIEYSTDKKRLIMGTGDLQLSIDELNLCLEY